MNDLVITFQVQFITDQEIELINNEDISSDTYITDDDIDQLYIDTTIKYGYSINNNVITINNS